MGIAAFAFGIGGPVANFAGLLHMTMHSLTKSAIFFAVGHIAQVSGTQRISDIRGLSVSHPALAFVFALCVVAIAGMPPFGVFTSEFLLLTSAFAARPLLAALAGLGILVAFGALIWRLQGLLFGEPTATGTVSTASLVPIWLHIVIVLIAGIWIPSPVAQWFEQVARLLG
jgi:hydrogenase-4 component F